MTKDVQPPPDSLPSATELLTGPDARVWCVVEYLSSSYEELGRPGLHREPVSDLANLYTYLEAWEALQEWLNRHPGREFSIRRTTPVKPILAALCERPVA